MMKKLCALLLALTLCLSCAAAETTWEIWLHNWNLVPCGDGSYMLHLLMGKDGGALQIDNASVIFFDAEGANIPVQSVTLDSSPLTQLPEGEHYFPLTLRVVPQEGAEIADVRLSEVQASLPETTPELPQSATPGHFMMKTDNGDEMTAFITAFAGEDATRYVGFAFVFDQEGNYLGNVALPRGRAQYVEGEQMLQALSESVGWTQVQLLRAGFSRENPDCVLFSHISMSGLPQGVAPGSAYIYIYGYQETPSNTLEITGFTLEAGEGSFRIEALAQNMSDRTVRLEEVTYVMLQDEAGEVRTCEAVTLDAPYRTVEPGQTLPFVLTGALEEGFVPVACGFDTGCAAVDAPDHEQLTGGSLPEGADVSDVIAVTICMDTRTGRLYGVEWTQPGQVTLAQGRLTAPLGELVDAAPEGARVLQTFCRLLPAE